MKLNHFYNEDCFLTIKNIINNGIKVDVILTSPPYNMTKRKGGNADSGRYDVYTNDFLSENDYIDFTLKLFYNFNKIIVENGVVLYNFSYSIENPSLPYKLVNAIVGQTEWDVADTIVWKKNKMITYPSQPKHLCRYWEFIWVFARKSEMKSFNCYKKVSKISEKTGQIYYKIYNNFIEARNNDKATVKLNQATFSTELCIKLLSLYAKQGDIIYDPFMGTGTTANACKQLNMNYIGSEISKAQCEYSKKRLNYDKEDYSVQ